MKHCVGIVYHKELVLSLLSKQYYIKELILRFLLELITWDFLSFLTELFLIRI